MDDKIKLYLYGFRYISTKCRTRYLLTKMTTLLLYPTDQELKDFIYNSGGMDFIGDNE